MTPADDTITVEDPAGHDRPRSRRAARFARENWTLLAGGLLLVMLVIASVAAPLIASFGPQEVAVADRLSAPNSRYWFGTDNLGRDVFARTLFGGRLSLQVGGTVVVVAVGGGTVLGLLTGFYKKVDLILMRVVDGLMAFPALVLAVAMIGVLGAGATTVVIALSVIYAPRVGRVVRSSVLVLRESPMVEAERSLGAGSLYILFRHVLPNCLSPIIVQASFIFSYAVLGEAALSFLGVGVPPDVPSWGNVLTDARTYLTQAWWMSIFPGIAIMLTVLSLNVVGDGLRDWLDPRISKARA